MEKSLLFKEANISKEVSAQIVSQLSGYLKRIGASDTIPLDCDGKDFFSNIVGGLLKVYRVERGHISLLLRVKAAVTNAYGGLHGGAVASVAEMVAVACARTVVGKEKELFLGELSNSYLSAAPQNAEVIVDASVVRSGRNLTVVAVEFRMKESEKLVYTSRATFYNMPVSSL
ncbi:Phenylacetic acid degradation-related domain-containing protein [Heracleum sosnowskyi]|uniref:Phenylacetic acid degradation-related domain-containing protein n=1 Tax=Heracleum sosnowskyi TaxID=360622 RepID=A0AAD8HCD0_9APIA|nr:Phenylacetic acid degradation-related domain-containing protein [Heracleum sosnowskyi]